jgi:hypothetical protein
MRRTLPILAVALVAVASSLPGWLAPVRWTPDGFFYQARMLTLRGVDEDVAVRKVLTGPLVADAAEYTDGVQLDRLRDAAWVEHTTEITRRRILVPLLGAAVYPVFGDFSLQAVSLLGYIAFAPLLYVLLRRRFSVRASAAVAAGMALLPPTREWSFHPLTDSWGLTLEVASLLAAVLVVDRGGRWLPLWVASVGALAFTRDAAVIAVLAALWLALRHRTRVTVALAATGIAAAAPAPLLFGAPVGATVGHASADAGRYWASLSETVRIDVLAEMVRPEQLLPGLALLCALALAPLHGWSRLARLRKLALPACIACVGLTLAATAVLAIRHVEPQQQLPVGVVLALGLLLLALPARAPDAYLRLHRAGAVGCAAYLALFPVPSGFRLELAFLPLIAVGFARALDARLPQQAPSQASVPSPAVRVASG